MTPEQELSRAFSRAWNNECDGSCENHSGECKVVHVECWGYWSYCDEAIAEDVQRGLRVTVQNVVQMSRVDDQRSESERAKQELGIVVGDCER
jgi:hypothetical protein